MNYEINTYTDKNKFIEENDYIGHCNNIAEFDLNIWQCDLYRNKQTGRFSLFIIRNNDEQWIVLEI